VHVIFNAIKVGGQTVPAPAEKRPFLLGFVGRIQFTKGVDTLVEWFDYAYNRGLDIKLFIRGESAPDEMDYDAKVRKMVKDRNLEEKIIFEGKLEGFDKIYGNIHANVVSSVVPDPLPRSVMEACSLGIPVIGYPAGGIPYMIEDGKSGLLVANAEQFHETVKQLMEDQGFYNSISQHAVERAKDKFAMPRLHDAVYETVYKTLA
jgi:glycosyltransferase involved in cell wall biosynthesis